MPGLRSGIPGMFFRDVKRGNNMGEVRANVRLRNFGDVATVAHGHRTEDQIPTSHLDCLVDTGAVMVLLPQDEVEKLNLVDGDPVIVTYADERREERPTARGLEVTACNRTMVTDCVVGPPLCEPLIGQLVLEALDLVVDCQHQRLGPRPESPNRPLLKLK
uniref:Clan AA aspartic protease, AF_0612 family n=1 Tax=Candidatus Kentrum sp. FW TaxID=2126338 RepID=A0A450SFT9_9GAMM|nr:MAG: hypothetical protein BECKFW1821B_GA0114236_101025 [Candidatus Kentron sp. FW]